MCGRHKSIPVLKSSKKLLSVCIMCFLAFLVSSCAGRAGYKQIVSNFWEDESRTSVILTFSEQHISAAHVPGGIDEVSFAIDTAINVALWGASGLVPSIIVGPTRERGDPAFQKKIHEVVIRTIRAENDYFFDHFLKKLSFSPNITPDFKVSSMEQLRSEEQEGMAEPADQYLIVDLFLGFSGKEKSWSTKVKLAAVASLWLIKDDETFHRFLNGEYKLKQQTLLCHIEDAPDIQDERPKIVWVIALVAGTKHFAKDRWLADNSQFFDQQLKFALANLASGINQRVLNIK